ncbi:methylosome subunit pICln-like [Rhopilema esculentum]|uniref:methylosome subunit pICln-like n=1 Tax=Rhopilema esculentum TaxID=499914 RepID=UPI0031CF0E2A
MVKMDTFESSIEDSSLKLENVKLYFGQECAGSGKLSISDENITWGKEGVSETVTLEYPFISVHGISTDTSSFPYQCVFCLLDTELPGNLMNQEDSESKEVRIVPEDSTVLQKIYDYIAEGQRNHPDPDEEEEEYDDDDMQGEFYGEDCENVDNIELSEEGQAVLNRLAQNMSMPSQEEFAALIKPNGHENNGQFDDAES